MKTRPILFTTEMVVAILEGRKTQTRRRFKGDVPAGADDAGVIYNSMRDRHHGSWCWLSSKDIDEATVLAEDFFYCPYGVPGDILWPRESGKLLREAYDNDPETNADLWRDAGWMHNADGLVVPAREYDTPLTEWIGDCTKLGRPNIHMPRWANRLTLPLEDIRLEPLLDITEADALAEGIKEYPDGFHWVPNPEPAFCRLVGQTARQAYFALWDEINGQGHHATNPWVWAMTFDPQPINVDAYVEKIMLTEEAPHGS